MKLRLGNMLNYCLKLCNMIGIENRIKMSLESIELEAKTKNHVLFIVILLDFDNVGIRNWHNKNRRCGPFKNPKLRVKVKVH